MKIVALYSIKGGVGKTASAVNLAFLAAQGGYRTLVWDLDPQAASSFYFRIKPKLKGGGKQLFAGDSELEDLIKATDFPGLDLLPADFAFRNHDFLLDAKKKPTRQLKKRLKPLAEAYDFVFLDCPPNLSLLSEAVFVAADVILLPLIPTTLSLRTLTQLQDFMAGHELAKLPLLPFCTMVDRRKSLHKDMMRQLSATVPKLLQTVIPYASDIERMGLERRPLGAFCKSGPSVRAYNELWQELLARIGVVPRP
jgi:cellulose biosynthesis protein BcsQ